MITRDDLLSAGYRPFSQRNLKTFTSSFWQKCIWDGKGKGKKYYITIAEYDNTNLPNIVKISGGYSYQPSVQFISGEITFDIDMLSPENVKQMEDFFDKVWYNLGCDYYEEYDY